MTTNFELTSGRNRALVCYCATTQLFDFARTINSVFNDAGIQTDNASNGAVYGFPDSTNTLNIALYGPLELYKKGDFEGGFDQFVRRLRVGGTFTGVCVGVFFYDQPAPPPSPEPDPDEELDEEPEPAPSITSLVCDALRENFGGVYGASAFVIPNIETAFTLEVE